MSQGLQVLRHKVHLLLSARQLLLQVLVVVCTLLHNQPSSVHLQRESVALLSDL